MFEQDLRGSATAVDAADHDGMRPLRSQPGSDLQDRARRGVSQRIQRSLEGLGSRSDALTRLRRIIAGSITLAGYVKLLENLYPVQRLVERTARTVGPCGGTLHDVDLRRADRIAADLDTLGGTSGVILPATSDLTRQLKRQFEAAPVSVIGAIYVFESTRLGLSTLARAVSRHLALPTEVGHGLDYLLDDLLDLGKPLEGLRREMDTWSSRLGLDAYILEAARTTAEGLCRILCNATAPAIATKRAVAPRSAETERARWVG